MRRSVMCAAGAGLLQLAGAGGCARPPACEGIACAAACPRDAALDASGRCACAEGGVAVLGACVPLRVADGYCGPGERMDPVSGGCVFRACAAGEALDVAKGACTPRGLLAHGGAIACPEGAVPIVENARAVCAAPAAACPRGAAVKDHGCQSPPACPAGALPDSLPGASACRPVVTAGGQAGRRVDLGAWATLAIGVDGGLGAPSLCQPLAQRPGVFGALAGQGPREADLGAGPGPRDTNLGAGLGPRDTNLGAGPRDTNLGAGPGPRDTNLGAGPGPRDTNLGMTGRIGVAVAILAPDQDVSRVHAEVRARDAAGRDLGEAAGALVSDTVSSLVEMLRGLGGEASSAAVELEVSCDVER